MYITIYTVIDIKAINIYILYRQNEIKRQTFEKEKKTIARNDQSLVHLSMVFIQEGDTKNIMLFHM